MSKDLRDGRYHKMVGVHRSLDFDLRRMNKNTVRWLLASAIAVNSLWAWLIWRGFHPDTLTKLHTGFGRSSALGAERLPDAVLFRTRSGKPTRMVGCRAILRRYASWCFGSVSTSRRTLSKSSGRSHCRGESGQVGLLLAHRSRVAVRVDKRVKHKYQPVTVAKEIRSMVALAVSYARMTIGVRCLSRSKYQLRTQWRTLLSRIRHGSSD